MFLLIYVEDIIITSSDPKAIDDLLSLLKMEFVVKDLGPLYFFHGVEVLRADQGLLISQR